MGYKVPVGLSNKHLHLSEEHIEILFGKGHKLTPTKDLVQPGQFASEEKVDIVGPKGTLKGIRVLGPARPQTQIELAMTDARTIGIKAPIRELGWNGRRAEAGGSNCCAPTCRCSWARPVMISFEMEASSVHFLHDRQKGTPIFFANCTVSPS